MTDNTKFGTSGPGKHHICIPSTCPCFWCGGTMERRGVTRLGSGLNTFSMWCTRCHAVTIYFNPEEKIETIETTIHYSDEKPSSERK